MRLTARLLEYIRDCLIAFYRSTLKQIINAHQLIAHWRNRIHRKQKTPQNFKSTNAKRKEHIIETQIHPQHHKESSCNSITNRLNKQSSSLSTTSNPRRLKLYSIFSRLSLRNFMEYCVIALNEASSSSCSNKFDLSTCDRPIWLLGRQYELPREANLLIDDIRSKLWITYRRNFPPIDEANRFTTDRGFGCMIRCGQMVLANALLHKNLGRDWRWSPEGLEANPEVYVKILKLFQDKEGCPYSIHNIVRTGQLEGKVIGEWFGPNTIAQALKRMALALSKADETSNEVLISIDAALDNVVVIDEIKSRFKQRRPIGEESSNLNQLGDNLEPIDKKTEENWIPGILFIQLRLGLNKINSLYFAALRKTFQLKNSLGIIGGRPNHALYLIGYTDDDIIYLDPHSTQQYIDLDLDDVDRQLADDVRVSPIDSTYHCVCTEKMPLDRLDPSLALCFYFHTEQEFDEWCQLSTELLIKSEQAPMFEITKSRPSGWNITLTSTNVKSTPDFCQTTLDKHSSKIRNPNSDSFDEKYTNLTDSDLGVVDDFELKPVDRRQANDDEEFEMLG